MTEFMEWQIIRLEALMEAANQTMDSQPQLHAEIAASKLLVLKHGPPGIVEQLIAKHETPWTRGRTSRGAPHEPPC